MTRSHNNLKILAAYLLLSITLVSIIRICHSASPDSLQFSHMGSLIPRRNFPLISNTIDPTATHEIVIALKQNNLEQLERFVLDRANPTSAQYLSEPLTFDEIGEIIRNQEAYEATLAWLNTLPNAQITWESPRREYIKVQAPITTWETALNAQFQQYRDDSHPKKPIYHRTAHYHLPQSLTQHIVTIFNTIQVPPPYKKTFVKDIPKSQAYKRLRPDTATHRKLANTPQQVNIAYLNNLYDVPSNLGNSSLKQSVFSTNSQYFSPQDLLLFQQANDLTVQACAAPFGFTTADCSTSTNPTNAICDEGNLDVQFIMGMAQNVGTIYWYNSDTDPFVAFVTGLTAMKKPPLANSISWGTWESSLNSGTVTSFNTEVIKLSAMGGTVTVSSGDDGAANSDSGNNCQCTTNTGSATMKTTWNGPAWTGMGYTPSFPASSPWVTAVGATMGPNTGGPEVAAQGNLGGVITTGGGFSVTTAAPSWQTKAIAKYFSQIPTHQMPSSGYNPNGRGYPDISFIGVNYAVVIGGEFYSVYGTSASSPVFAGMVSLVNSLRSQQGKHPIGFLNPTLYSLGMNSTSNFNDVTTGNNHCCAQGSTPSCCQSGFNTSVGWDPVTGWGSISFITFAGAFGTQVALNEVSTDPALYSEALVVAVSILGSTFLFFTAVGLYFGYYTVFVLPRVKRLRQEQEANWGLPVDVDPASVLSEPIIRRHDNPLQPGPRTPPRNRKLDPDSPIRHVGKRVPVVSEPALPQPLAYEHPELMIPPSPSPAATGGGTPGPVASKPFTTAPTRPASPPPREIRRHDNPLQPGPRTPPRERRTPPSS